MESTGVYWIPAYEVLQDRGLEVLLVNAKHVRTVPGRKSDVLDCQWLQRLHTFGLLRGSFRPSAEIVELRAYLRLRQMLVRYAAAHVQHIQKALSEMNVQLHTVVSDITGLTGMKIIRDIVAGNHNPELLSELRNYRCRASNETIKAALTGNYREEHLFALQQALKLYDSYMERMEDCDKQIEQCLLKASEAAEPPPQPAPKAKARQRPQGKQPRFEIQKPLYHLTGADITQIAGIAPLTALSIISEIGTDMTRWLSVKHFTSWLNLAPGCKRSGGRDLSSRRPSKRNRVANLLRQAATTIGRTSTALGAFHRRKAARIGKGKAIVATAHKLARLIYSMLRYGRSFEDPGSNAYELAHHAKVVKHLTRRARTLGFQLVPVETTSQTAVVSPVA
jgi:transposase